MAQANDICWTGDAERILCRISTGGLSKRSKTSYQDLWNMQTFQCGAPIKRVHFVVKTMQTPFFFSNNTEHHPLHTVPKVLVIFNAMACK